MKMPKKIQRQIHNENNYHNYSNQALCKKDNVRKIPAKKRQKFLTLRKLIEKKIRIPCLK